jgi:hypothetical protein
VIALAAFAASTIVVFIPMKNEKTTEIFVNETKKGKNEDKVYIAVMSGAPLRDEIEYTYSQWYEKLLYSGSCVGVGFFIDSPIKTLAREVEYHVVRDPDDRSIHKLLSKLYNALQYFIENTDAGWFLRLCEDTAVNLRTFPLFLDELNENYDPLTDPVIQGACLGKTNSTYLQGGSGFVFSRKAAIEIYNDFDWFREMSMINKADDRILGYYLEKIGMPAENITSRWFVGHAFLGRNSALEAVSDLSGYYPCSEPVSKKGCRRFLTKVKDITFWHDRVKFKNFVTQIDVIRDIAPDNLYFFVPINKPVMCLGTNNTVGKYF